jgi:hypothetical protein
MSFKGIICLGIREEVPYEPTPQKRGLKLKGKKNKIVCLGADLYRLIQSIPGNPCK